MARVIKEKRDEAGFTLVELSIVLVIIGLIVGGILAGQDMIKAAQVRATVSQTEKYNTATNTFKDKYGVLPGDAGQTAAVQFGMNVPARGTAATGGTDQDGLLECIATGCATVTAYGSETSIFWSDLSWAVLINESLQNTTGAVDGGAGANITPGGGTSDMALYVPEAKIGRGNYYTVFSVGGRNFYQLAGITQITNGTGAYAVANRLTAQEAFNIDQKMDDGRPNTGGVRALDAADSAVLLNNGVTTFAAPSTPGAAASGTCVTTVVAGTYQTTTTDDANTPSCMLRMMFN